jgi:hypothetical protein
LKGKVSAGAATGTTDVMGQGTSRDHLLEQPVQKDETIGQKQQQRSQIPMGQVPLLDFFEPSS